MSEDNAANPNVICSISWKESSVGVSIYDSINGKLSIYSNHFNESKNTIEHLINKCQFDHLLLPLNTQEEFVQYIESLKNQSNFEIIYRSPKHFLYEEGLNSLERIIFTVPDNEQNELRNLVFEGINNLSSKSIICSIGSIINYYEEITKNEGITISSISSLELLEGLFITRELMEELQIISEDIHPSIHIRNNKKEGLSLFALLNRCSTRMGKTKLRSWFFMTNNSINEIEERLDIIELFTQPKMYPLINELINFLSNTPEIRNILINLQKGICTNKHWQRLYRGLCNVSKICQFVSKNPIFYNFIKFQNLNIENSQKLQKLINEIESTINLNTNNNEVEINDTFNKDLYEKRKQYIGLESIMTEVANEFMQRESQKINLSVIFIPQYGFLIKLNHNEISEYIPNDFTIEFETEYNYYYKNNKMKELDYQYGNIYNDIINEENRIIFQLSNKILSFSQTLNELWNLIGIIDSICSLSIVAVECNYVKPQFTDSKEIIIKNGRHPLLERINDLCVPNSIEMNEEENLIHIITGTNCSGKSIYLKQIGLIIFMAYLGSFVPAEEAIIPHIKYLLGMFHNSDTSKKPFTSNFMEEVIKINEFLSKSNSSSLLLIDEFCKSSTVEDGSSLLYGFIKYLHEDIENYPFTFISTHFHYIFKENIISLNYFVPCLMDVKIQDENDEIIFLYQMKKGIYKTSSFGIQCAVKANINPNIIERAKVIRDSIENFKEIKPNPLCFDVEKETKTRQAIKLFLQWNEMEILVNYLWQLIRL